MKESTQVGDDSLLNETLGLEQIISTCLCGLMRAFCNLNKAWLQTSQAFWRSTLMGHKFASWDFFLRFLSSVHGHSKRVGKVLWLLLLHFCM